MGVRGLEQQTGVVGVESVSISIPEFISVFSGACGGGVVRLRTLIFFFLTFLGFRMFRGDGLVALGVRATRLRVWDSSSSLANCMEVLTLFFSWAISSANLLSSSFLISISLVSAASQRSFSLFFRYVSASWQSWFS